MHASDDEQALCACCRHALSNALVVGGGGAVVGAWSYHGENGRLPREHAADLHRRWCEELRCHRNATFSVVCFLMQTTTLGGWRLAAWRLIARVLPPRCEGVTLDAIHAIHAIRPVITLRSVVASRGGAAAGKAPDFSFLVEHYNSSIDHPSAAYLRAAQGVPSATRPRCTVRCETRGAG